MPWQFTEHHVRPNVFYWSPKAYKERDEVKSRREQAQKAYVEAKVGRRRGAWERGAAGAMCHVAATMRVHLTLLGFI